MSWQFGRVDLQKTLYTVDPTLNAQQLKPVPVNDVQRVYRDYCLHKHFLSVIPMIPGRLTNASTELFGYYDQDRLVAWSMYQLWDDRNILCDHFAWDYRNPKLRLGIRSLENECAVYRDRGFRYMYFEAIEPYMLDIEGFEVLGAMK